MKDIDKNGPKSEYFRCWNFVFSDNFLSIQAKALLCALLRDSSEFFPTRQQLMSRMGRGVSKSSYNKGLNELRQFGIITISRKKVHGDGITIFKNVYSLNPVEVWRDNLTHSSFVNNTLKEIRPPKAIEVYRLKEVQEEENFTYDGDPDVGL